MEIPRSYVDNYTATLNTVSAKAKEKLIAALLAIDYNIPFEDVKLAVMAVMQAACGASTDVTAAIAAEFYDGLRQYFVGERLGAVALSMRNPDATTGAVAAFLQMVLDEEPIEAFADACAGRLDYENNKAANMCVVENAKHDPLKPKWARIPQGVETCAYCLILASFGFTYNTSEVASHSHDDCDCKIVPGWDGAPKVGDYEGELEKYKTLYDDAMALLSNREEMPEELRLRIESAKNKHLADVRAGRKHTKWTKTNELAIAARWLYPELH